MLPKHMSPTGAEPCPRQVWPCLQVEGDVVDLSRAALPQQGSGCSFPVPWEAPLSWVGTGCGRWTQPWADTDRAPEGRSCHGGDPSSCLVPRGCCWFVFENMDFSRGALSWTPALTIVSVCGNRNHQCLLQTKESGLPQRLLMASLPWRWSFCTACHWREEGQH